MRALVLFVVNKLLPTERENSPLRLGERFLGRGTRVT